MPEPEGNWTKSFVRAPRPNPNPTDDATIRPISKNNKWRAAFKQMRQNTSPRRQQMTYRSKNSVLYNLTYWAGKWVSDNRSISPRCQS